MQAVYGGLIMPSSKHLFDKIDDMMSDDQNDKIKKLEDIINDLTFVITMYLDDYPFDANYKAKQQILVNYAHLLIDTPINIRGMAKHAGVKYAGNDLVEVVLTEEEAKHTLDILYHLTYNCSYSEEAVYTLENINKQIHNQIEYEPSRGT